MKLGIRPIAVAALVCLILSTSSAAMQSPQDLAERATVDLEQGRLIEAVAGFDRLAALVPGVAPLLWQRGVALYELGRFDECAAQFASYHKENPDDAENVTWHFLCVARRASVARAREAMLPAGSDPRVLRAQIVEMLRGQRTPENLVALGRTSVTVVRFYAFFYAGLYEEAAGNRGRAVEYLTAAAADDLREEGGLMNAIGRQHLARLIAK